MLRVVSFESVYSALSDDVWYCSGWYCKFLRNTDLKSRHAKCVRSAWPECIDSVARCGSSTGCASMDLARCGSSSTCARYGATIFPVCLAFHERKISLNVSSVSCWWKNASEPKVSLILKEHFSCGNLPQKLLAHVHILGLKRPIHITCEWLKTMRSRRLVTVSKKWVTIGLTSTYSSDNSI